MLFSVNWLVSAWLSNISVGWGEWRRRAFTRSWTALIWICWNETARAWGSQIALCYPYITGWDSKGLCLFCRCVCVLICIKCLRVWTVYAHWLTFTVPSVSAPAHFALLYSFFFSMSKLWLSSLLVLSLYLCFHHSPFSFPSLIASFIHSPIPPPLSPSSVCKTHSKPASP